MQHPGPPGLLARPHAASPLPAQCTGPGNPRAISLIDQADAPPEAATYTYDLLGRLQTANNAHRKLRYAYNLAGDLTEEQ
ncbi:MAG: hypothetical protein HC765_15000, partial [Brachymonas sp.]|nr:hypothetical protein [Brachymonas sp.]